MFPARPLPTRYVAVTSVAPAIERPYSPSPKRSTARPSSPGSATNSCAKGGLSSRSGTTCQSSVSPPAKRTSSSTAGRSPPTSVSGPRSRRRRRRSSAGAGKTCDSVVVRPWSAGTTLPRARLRSRRSPRSTSRRERQNAASERVLAPPAHPQERQRRVAVAQLQLAVEQGVGEEHVLRGRVHLDQLHHLAAGRVGVGGESGRRAADLLEEKKIAGHERGPDGGRGAARRGEEPGLGRALGQAALLVPPGVHEDLVVLLVALEVACRLEHESARERRVGLERLGRDPERLDDDAGRLPLVAKRCDHARHGCGARRQELRAGDAVGHADVQIGRRVGSLVHPVVDEARQAAHGDSPAGRFQIGLVRDGVLEVGKPIARVGEQLDERDAEICGVPLREARVELRQEVEQQLPEAGVVLRQVVESGRRACRRHIVAERGRDVDGAARPKGEDEAAKALVELLLVDLEHVGREVAHTVDAHVEHTVVDPVCAEHAHADDARPALDRDALGLVLEPVGVRRQVVEEVDMQQEEVDGVYFDEVEPIQRRMPDDSGAARALVGADDVLVHCAHVTPPGRAKRSTRRSSAARRR